MSAAATTAAAIRPPDPLVGVARHPLKWIKNKVMLTVTGLTLGHIGMLIIVALYFIFWESSTFNFIAHWLGYSSMKDLWHHLVSNSITRHNIRDVLEGFLGGMLGQMIVWNHYRRTIRKPTHALDRLEMFLGIPNVRSEQRSAAWQYPYGLIVSLAYGIPGFLAGTWVVNKIAHGLSYAAPYVGAHSAYYQKVLSIWTGSAPHVIIGLCASLFLARRPLKKLYDDIQLELVDRRVAMGKPLRFYHILAPTFQARFNERSFDRKEVQAEYHGSSNAVPIMLMVLIPLGLAAAAYGYYVLTVIATRGH